MNTLSLFAGAVPLRSAHFGPGTGPIHIGSASCDGSEQRIVDCQLQYENKCVHSEDAGVNCPCKETLEFSNNSEFCILSLTACVHTF